jgi:multicomponent Na+:H+ antiporter subunit A
MLLAVGVCFALALIAPLAHRALGRHTGPVLALVPAGVFAYLLQRLPEVSRAAASASGAIVETWSWVPDWNVALSLRLDGLSLLFALLITGIGALVFAYSGAYMHKHGGGRRFYPVLAAFMGSMLGVVLADDLIALFVFWELTSITSYLLIGFDHEKLGSRKSALQALLVTGAGGLALLAGLVLLMQATGVSSLSGLLGGSFDLPSHALYPGIVLLVALGAFTKSAQWPFHFWLPSAMVAPTPVSTYLHSATMVKAGVYLLARLQPVLSGDPLWHGLLSAVGLLTVLTGAVMAVTQTDLKRLLAYATVAALGTMVLLTGIGTEKALAALPVYILGHALYKAALFLVAGLVDMRAKTRDIRELGGLWRSMPVTAAAALLAGLSFAGLPPALGYLAKELTYKAGWAASWGTGITAGLLLAKVLLFVVAFQVAVRPLLGAATERTLALKEGPGFMLLGPALLALSGMALGLAGEAWASPLLAPAAGAVAGAAPALDLSLWHGFVAPFWLSVATVGLGILALRCLPLLNRLREALAGPARFGPERGYEGWLDGTLQLGHWQTAVIQNGRLRSYVLTILLVVLALAGTTYVHHGGLSLVSAEWTGIRAYELMIALVTLVGAVATTLSRGRLTAVATLGVAGFGVALLFLFFGGPDLSVTQFAVETLSVLLLVVVLYRLPRMRPLSSRLVRLRDALVAGLVGAFVSLLVLSAFADAGVSQLGRWFAEHSYPEGKGRNVVNVILVDFRALDTLGEITVIGVAAIGVLSLLRLRARRAETASSNQPEIPVREDLEASR